MRSFLGSALGGMATMLLGAEAQARDCRKPGQKCERRSKHKPCCSDVCCAGACCAEGERCTETGCCPRIQSCGRLCCPPENVGCTEKTLPDGTVIVGCLCKEGLVYDPETNRCLPCPTSGDHCPDDDPCCVGCKGITEGPCQTNDDCCGDLLCGVNGPIRRCFCREQGDECFVDADCCPEAGGCIGGRCGGCIGLFANDVCPADGECCNDSCVDGECEKAPVGDPCEAGVDCQSLNCENGFCASCRPPGSACDRESQCCGTCLNNVCCRGQNFSCGGQADCCAGLTCTGGTCQ